MIEPLRVTLPLIDQNTLGITIFPTQNRNAPILLLYPAFGVKATYYAKFAKQLTQVGIQVITADLRGHGLSSVRPDKTNNYGFQEMIADLKAVSDYTKEKFPTQKIYLLGHSLGGQTASLAIAKYPNLANGLIIIGAPNVHYKNWSGIHYYRRKLLVQLLPAFGAFVALFPKLKIGGYYTTKKQAQEWGYTGKTGKYQVIGDHLDYKMAFKKVNCPILSIFIEDDGMVPKLAMEKLAGKFTQAKVTDITLTHQMAGQKVSHINWPRTATQAMVNIIEDWIAVL